MCFRAVTISCGPSCVLMQIKPRRRGLKAEESSIRYGFVAGAGAADGGVVVCGAVVVFGPGRAGPVVVVFSVVLGPGVSARSLAKRIQPPMAMRAATSSNGKKFQSPSSVRVTDPSGSCCVDRQGRQSADHPSSGGGRFWVSDPSQVSFVLVSVNSTTSSTFLRNGLVVDVAAPGRALGAPVL